MQLANFLPVLLSTCALASPILPINDLAVHAPDNAAKVVQDFAVLSKKLTTLNNTLNTFKPFAVLGVVTADQIQKETAAISDQITRTTQDARASSNWTSAESYNVAFATINLIAPINSTLSNIVAHKRSFATAVLLIGDLSQTVEQTLEQQRILAETLGTVVQSKLAEPYASYAPVVQRQLLGIFDAAIRKYKNCRGVLCLPAIPS